MSIELPEVMLIYRYMFKICNILGVLRERTSRSAFSSRSVFRSWHKISIESIRFDHLFSFWNSNCLVPFQRDWGCVAGGAERHVNC